MAVNTRIILPIHVNAERVAKLVAKIAGAQTELAFLDSDKRKKLVLNPDAPSCEENPWTVNFVGSFKDRPHIETDSSRGFASGDLVFMDAAGNKHSWFYYLQGDHEDRQELMPGCHGFSVAIGRRLVRFFGGALVESDAVSSEDIKLRVPNARAKFPKKHKSQSSNDRWYQFQNALNNEPVLSYHELKDAMDSYGGVEKHQELLDYLEVLDRRQALEKIAEEASPVESCVAGEGQTPRSYHHKMKL